MRIFSLHVQIYAEVCNRETGIGNSKYTEPFAGYCNDFIPWWKSENENFGNFPQNAGNAISGWFLAESTKYPQKPGVDAYLSNQVLKPLLSSCAPLVQGDRIMRCNTGEENHGQETQ